MFNGFIINFSILGCIENKITNFVDFCSVANISMFIMTHTQFGYYIHGRSPHGNADTSMQNMAEFIAKEEDGITANRGLEQNSDQQTFSILISNKLSKQYGKVILPLHQRKSKRISGTSSSEFEKRNLAYTQLNRFLMGFIDNVCTILFY